LNDPLPHIFNHVRPPSLSLPCQKAKPGFAIEVRDGGEDEMKRLATEGKSRDGIKMDNIKQIIPISDDMIVLMDSINGQQSSG